jgi:hypothetical protein
MIIATRAAVSIKEWRDRLTAQPRSRSRFQIRLLHFTLEIGDDFWEARITQRAVEQSIRKE